MINIARYIIGTEDYMSEIVVCVCALLIYIWLNKKMSRQAKVYPGSLHIDSSQMKTGYSEH